MLEVEAEYDDLTVVLERGAIAALLQQNPVDGSLACLAWPLTRAARA